MGASADQTLREIDQLRTRIDHDLDALGDVLPPKEALIARLAIAAVGGVVTVLTVWFLAHRLKVRGQERRVKRLVQEAIVELNSRERPQEVRG